MARTLKVFLCHSRADKVAVRLLYERLRAGGVRPWLDEEDLLPGQDWQREIPKAVRASDAVIVCLSRNAVTQAGYVQKEILYALDVAAEQPEGTLFLLPVRLEDCEVPDRLRRWQWVDLFQQRGYERLEQALAVRLESLKALEPGILGGTVRKEVPPPSKKAPLRTTKTPGTMEARFRQLIAEQLGIDEEEVTLDASFVKDLGADSLDVVELVMAVEEEFGLEIPDADAEKIRTVRDAVAGLRQALQ